jgi:hypothetical protein
MRILIMALAALLLLSSADLAKGGAQSGKAGKHTKAAKAAKAEEKEEQAAAKCWPRYQVGGRIFENRSYTTPDGVLHIVLVEMFPNECPATALTAAAQ